MPKLHKSIENFDAKAARELTNSCYESELREILNQIKSKARDGHCSLYVNGSIPNNVEIQLKDRGFHIDYFEASKDSHIEW